MADKWKRKVKEIKLVKTCHVEVKAAYFCHSVVARLASPPAPVPDPNGNNDSGYAASNVEETALQAGSNPNSPRRRPVPPQESSQKVSTLCKFSLLLLPAPTRWLQLPPSP